MASSPGKRYRRYNHSSKRRKTNSKKRAAFEHGTLTTEFKRVRIGFLLGIGAITLSSAFMNVSGWVSMAASFNQAVANGLLSGGMELIAICALPFAGFMMKTKHYGKAALALAIAGAALSINIYATQNFLHLQTDQLINGIELSGLELSQIEAQISDINREIESIIESNNGFVPRDIETIEGSYANLNAEENPINMMRRDAEIGARQRYEELMAQKDTLRSARIDPSLLTNDQARSVIPPERMRAFVIILELMKATGLYAFGSSTLFWSNKQRTDHARKRKWAIINRRGHS